jgi:hypothetical protein
VSAAHQDEAIRRHPQTREGNGVNVDHAFKLSDVVWKGFGARRIAGAVSFCVWRRSS